MLCGSYAVVCLCAWDEKHRTRLYIEPEGQPAAKCTALLRHCFWMISLARLILRRLCVKHADPGKLIMYCKIHCLSSIERSLGAPRRPGKVNNIL